MKITILSRSGHGGSGNVAAQLNGLSRVSRNYFKRHIYCNMRVAILQWTETYDTKRSCWAMYTFFLVDKSMQRPTSVTISITIRVQIFLYASDGKEMFSWTQVEQWVQSCAIASIGIASFLISDER